MASQYGQNAVTRLGPTRSVKYVASQQQQNPQQRRERSQSHVPRGPTSLTARSQENSVSIANYGRISNGNPRQQQKITSYHGSGFGDTREADTSPVIGAPMLRSIPYDVDGMGGAVMECSQLTSSTGDWDGSGESRSSDSQRRSRGHTMGSRSGQEGHSQVSRTSSASTGLLPFQQYWQKKQQGLPQRQLLQPQLQEQQNRRFGVREAPVFQQVSLPMQVRTNDHKYAHLKPPLTVERMSSISRPVAPHQLAGKPPLIRGVESRGCAAKPQRQVQLRNQDLSQSSKSRSLQVGPTHSNLQGSTLLATTRTMTRTMVDAASEIEIYDANNVSSNLSLAQANALFAESFEELKKKIEAEQTTAADAFAGQVADAKKQIDEKTNSFMLQAADCEKKQAIAAESFDQQVTTASRVYARILEGIESAKKMWQTQFSFSTLVTTPIKAPSISPEASSTPSTQQARSLKSTTSKAPPTRSASTRISSSHSVKTSERAATSVKATTLSLATVFSSKNRQNHLESQQSVLSSSTSTRKSRTTSEATSASRPCTNSIETVPTGPKTKKELNARGDKKSSKSKQLAEPRHSKTVPPSRALRSCVTPCKKGANPLKINGAIGNASVAVPSKKRSIVGFSSMKPAKRIRKFSVPSPIFSGNDENDAFL